MDLSRRRRTMFVVGGVVLALVVAVVAVEFARRPGRGEGAPKASFSSNHGIPQPFVTPRRPETSKDDRLFKPAPEAAPGSQDDELSFDQLLAAIEQAPRSEKGAKLAEKFTADFKAEPELEKTYDGFRKSADEGKRPTASGFMAALRELPAFRKIVNEFMQAPGSGALMLSIGNQPTVHRFLEKDTARILQHGRSFRGAGPAAARGAGAASSETPSSRDSAFTRTETNMGGGAAESSRGGGQGTAYSSGQPGAQGGGGDRGHGGSVNLGGGGDTPGSQTSAAASAPADGSEAGGYNVQTQLTGPVDTASDPMKVLRAEYPFLNDFTDAELKALMEGTLPNGFWGECFRKGIFGECFDGCLQVKPTEEHKEISCSLPGGSGWTACMDAFDKDETTCIKRCTKQAPCAVPATVWVRHCDENAHHKSWKAPAYCADTPDAISKADKKIIPGCTASYEVCYLYSHYLKRLPEKGGAVGWESTIAKMREDHPEYTSDDIISRLAPQFNHSLEKQLVDAKADKDKKRIADLKDKIRKQNTAFQEQLQQNNVTGISDKCRSGTDCAKTIEMINAEATGTTNSTQQ
ncbi:MAG: hypothetical protein NTX64_04470 [Elusimicrobia bacterium]|nr:hypothetical protein [Elusimicrobiota bacterium]